MAYTMMRWLAVVILAVAFLEFVAACDPMTTVTFVNETQEKLNFYAKSDVEAALLGSGTAGPGSSHKEWMIQADYRSLRVAATREDGEWVFDHTYTRSELEKQKSRVVVTSLEPIAPPLDVKVVPSQGAPQPVLAPTNVIEVPAASATPASEILGTSTGP